MTCKHGSEFPHLCFECMEEDLARLREEVERLTADLAAAREQLRSRPSDPERVERVRNALKVSDDALSIGLVDEARRTIRLVIEELAAADGDPAKDKVTP